jgi:ABC-type multidrug transport system fused ATPase/permease subunit
MNTRPELVNAVWPATRIVEAMQALAQHAGLPVVPREPILLPNDVRVEQIGDWIGSLGEQTGIQIDGAFVTLDELDVMLSTAAPVLIRLSAIEGAPFLAVLGRRGRFVRALGNDFRVHLLHARTVVDIIRRPFEAAMEADVEPVLERLQLKGRSRARAKRAMLADRLRSARFRGCWLLRLPPGAPVIDAARENRLPLRLAVLVGAYVLQYGLFVLSWWLLGRGVLNDTVDRGWLLGWFLLLASLIPVRLLGTWNQGAAVVAGGVWLRRRLLRGASLFDRQELRRKGVGQLFGLVVEAAAIDALALTGGVVATFAVIELIIAALILIAGASPPAAPLLAGWLALTAYFGWRYFTRRAWWTSDRFAMSEQLLESMVGHRTRLAQQSAEDWHKSEDEALDHFIARGNVMDRASIWLSVVPRGWLVLALAALLPALAHDASAASLAISVGGSLLAYRALQRLVGGFSNLAGAVISARSISGLAAAAARHEQAGLPSVLWPSARPVRDDVVAQARELSFRYRAQGDPVLDNCSLNIPRNARLLLEGPSGSGKTTFASILAGLQSADSGLLLIDGLDRGALGAEGWRSRVTMATQAHDNYLVSGSLAFNLLMGRRWPAEPSDLIEAERVCRELGLGDLLDRLPGRLDQVVGETGWRLSQGERTRVFLARALLQKPDLLILDESFSALDSENMERALRCVSNRAQAVLAIAHV